MVLVLEVAQKGGSGFGTGPGLACRSSGALQFYAEVWPFVQWQLPA